MRAPAAAGVAGLVFVILFVVSLALLYREPPQGSTAAEIAAWYLQTQTKTIGLVGLYLLPFAGIAFLWFIAAIRNRIGAYEDRFFATVFLGSGILFVAMLYAAAATAGASLAAVRFQGAPLPSPDVFVFARGLAFPIAATAVGVIALIAAVPLTTGLAAALVARVPAQALPEGHHHHH